MTTSKLHRLERLFTKRPGHRISILDVGRIAGWGSYRQRISDLRAKGHRITHERDRAGSWFRLEKEN